VFFVQPSALARRFRRLLDFGEFGRGCLEACRDANPKQCSFVFSTLFRPLSFALNFSSPEELGGHLNTCPRAKLCF